MKQSACYFHTLLAASHRDPCCRLSFNHSEPWDASLETNLKLALSNPGPSHSQDHKELRSAVLFRGDSVAPYSMQLLVALASGTSVPDVSRSLQRPDCLACNFFFDLLTCMSQTWCGCSAVYGERVVIKISIKLNQFVSHPARAACARWFSASCKQSCLLSKPAILIIINGATELELLELSVHHTSRSSMSTVVSHSIKLT